MSLPPVAIAVLGLELCAWTLLLPMVWTSLRVLASWEPSSASARQLALERRVEQGSLVGRLAVLLFGLSSLVLLIALLATLPRVVPGAMCAAGVLEALPSGRTMVALRIATLLGAVVWQRLDALNRQAPLAPLVPSAARASLVFAAVAAVASWRTATALGGLDLERTVSCCTILYDLAAPGSPDAANGWLPGSYAAIGMAVSAVLVAGLAIGLGARARGRLRAGATARRPDPPAKYVVLGATTAAWALLGSLAIVDWSGPHVFGALGHRCPWCLFLPAHGGYGWWAFGLIALGVREALGMMTSEAAARRAPAVRRLVDRRQARSGVWLALLALLLGALVLWPVVEWRATTGSELLGRLTPGAEARRTAGRR